MKILSLIMLCLALVACDGIQFEDEITPSDTKKFTNTELKNKVLFSSDLLGRNIQNKFLLLFDSINVEEIVFKPDNNNVLAGKYNWNVIHDKLQVSYPLGVTCSSEKKDSDNQKIEIKTVVCEGGTPASAKIGDTLNKALSITPVDLSGDTLSIQVDDNNTEVFSFDSNNSFTITKQLNGQDATSENGTYKTSNYTNVIRLNFNGLGYYRLFILMQGSLSSGQLADLRFNEASNSLQEVRLMNILSSKSWKVDESFSNVEFDN